jgi:hypothetical protein
MGIVIIGLAAGLGIATHNYQQANTNLDAANANLTAATANLSAAKFVTSYSNLTNGCSDRATSVTGTKYSTHCQYILHVLEPYQISRPFY